MKFRLVGFVIIVILGFIISFFIYNNDVYDKEVFIFSASVFIFIIMISYGSLLSENINSVIKELEVGEASKKEIIKRIICGKNPRVRSIIIAILIILASISYLYIVPIEESDNLEFTIEDYYFSRGNTLVINYSLVNKGIRPVWVIRPDYYNNLVINITDADGKIINTDAKAFYYSYYRIKLHHEESYKDYRWLYNVSDNYYLTLQKDNRSIPGRHYWTYNTTLPYTVTITYDAWNIPIPVDVPIWRGLIQSNIIITDVP